MKIILLAIALLAGCTATRFSDSPRLAPSERMEWVVVSRGELYTTCGYTPRELPGLVACAIQIRETKTCWIYSTATEAEAKMPWRWKGENVYQHEMAHCQGERHDVELPNAARDISPPPASS